MEWIDIDEKHVWHPFTQVQTEASPIGIERGEGVYLYTADGRKLMDVNSSWWVNVHGHGHPVVVDAIKSQLDKLQHVIFAGMSHQPAAELCSELMHFLPDHLTKFFFSDNGSTSTEVALKMAFQYWDNQGEQRKKVLAIEGAYHGDTFGAMSVSERDLFNRPFEPFMFEVDYLPFPNALNQRDILNQVEELASGGDLAAFIFEPLVQGASGMRMYSKDLLAEIIKICQKYGVLCIADEVMTGFGRTGKMFAMDHLEQDADLVCLSKGLTGGYLPMGLTVTSEKIFKVFLDDEKRRGFLHGHSFTGNPLACAAALASTKLFREDSTWQQIEMIGAAHEEFIKKVDKSKLFNIRVLGTILALDVKSDRPGYFNPAKSKAYDFCIKKGLLIRPLGSTVFVNPPYCITHEELQTVYAVLHELLEEFN